MRIKIVIASGPNAGTYSAESMNTDTSVAGEYAGKVYNTNANGHPNFTSVAFGGRSLTSLMLDRTINPGDMSIVREILYDTTPDMTTTIPPSSRARSRNTRSKAGFPAWSTTAAHVSSNSANWRPAFDVNGDGFISVRDKDTGAVGAIIIGPDGQPLQLTSSRGALTDDIDLLKNIELLRFADKTIVIGGNNQLATGTVTIADLQNKLVNPADVSTTYDLDGNPATPALVTPYVGQVLTASLSGFADADGIPARPGNDLPVGLTFEWQTTETGGNAGWATIATGASYTVRSVDPGHILRAVALFEDSAGATEAIISAATDGATPAWRVNENSAHRHGGLDLYPVQSGLRPGPAAGRADGWRYRCPDACPCRQCRGTLQARHRQRRAASPGRSNGGSVNLNYEVDNEYQIVIDSYIDAATAAALDPAGRIASRQFTVLLNDVFEVPNTAATGAPVISDLTPLEGQPLTLNTASIADANGVGPSATNGNPPPTARPGPTSAARRMHRSRRRIVPWLHWQAPMQGSNSGQS